MSSGLTLAMSRRSNPVRSAARKFGRAASRMATLVAIVCAPMAIAGPASAAMDGVLRLDVVATSLSPLPRWSDLLRRHATQISAAAQCEGRLICRGSWIQMVTAVSTAEPANLLREVNRVVNQVRYVADGADTWSTPSEFARRGGDCEDFAIAKYLLLRQYGIPASQMRIVVMRPPNSDPHAILLVETAGGTIALDNLRDQPYAFGRQAAATIVYAFNETAMWLPTSSFRVAAR